MTLLLPEHHGNCTPGSTVFVWMTGVEDFHTEVTWKGIKYNSSGLQTTVYDAKCVEVTDPFSNRIRFNEPIEKNEA